MPFSQMTLIKNLANQHDKTLYKQLMDNPEQNQIFAQIHSKNREEDEMRYNFAKEVVSKTVE